jgi:hypothetical protein
MDGTLTYVSAGAVSHDLLMCGWCALTGSLADLFGWMLVGMLSVAVLH